MIKIKNVDVFGFESAIRGMRSPFNSWDKSDSDYYNEFEDSFHIGENDFDLMMKLIRAGSDHSKFMRMINVTMDIVAPLYWWKEFDTYKVGTIRNSCSTMHKIQSKKFELSDFSLDDFHLEDDEFCENDDYYDMDMRDLFERVIGDCEYLREKFVETGNKKYWLGLIQLLPCSYNQRATVQLNYAVLRNMYHARKNHKLKEWVDFCKWIETLPYSELITM